MFTETCSNSAGNLNCKKEKGDLAMEPITLCGLVIVMFGLWVEFEPGLKSIAMAVYRCKIFAEIISPSTVQRPAYLRKMPICAAKAFHN